MWSNIVLGRRDSDSGRTKFERVRQFRRTDHDFGRVNSKHWRLIRFINFISNLANEIQSSASKYISNLMFRNANKMRELQRKISFRHH